jgi:hypothetical protein
MHIRYGPSSAPDKACTFCDHLARHLRVHPTPHTPGYPVGGAGRSA